MMIAKTLNLQTFLIDFLIKIYISLLQTYDPIRNSLYKTIKIKRKT